MNTSNLARSGADASEVDRAAYLSVTNISKRYGKKSVLRDVSLAVQPGEAVALVGENGAGKTTLLRICGGLLAQDSGRVHAGGTIGYCPQQPAVLDFLTAREHLVLFGRAASLDRRAALDRGNAILSDFGFPVGDDMVCKVMSGGTRQKLNLALALLGEPPILLLDEPYQGFDHGTYVNFWDHVDAWRSEVKAILVVTHMLAELTRVDRVVELQRPSSARAA